MNLVSVRLRDRTSTIVLNGVEVRGGDSFTLSRTPQVEKALTSKLIYVDEIPKKTFGSPRKASSLKGKKK